MCCALNTETVLQNSTYSRLVEEMQGKEAKTTVPVSVGKKDGLTLILDLHSNRAALGTVAKNSDGFNIFFGKVSKTKDKQLLPAYFLRALWDCEIWRLG